LMCHKADVLVIAQLFFGFSVRRILFQVWQHLSKLPCIRENYAGGLFFY